MVKKYLITHKLPVFVFLDKEEKELFRLTGEVDKNKLVNLIKENINK
jgi:thioredoxin-related protein